jgi:hypothetical protein
LPDKNLGRTNSSVYKGYLKYDNREGVGIREYEDGQKDIGQWQGN